MQLELMASAESRLSELLSANKTTRINGFRVGTSAGFAPSKAGTAVGGTMMYIGAPAQIRYTVISLHEITFTIFIDHDVGEFTLGNLMMFLDPKDGTSQPIPFLWMSLNSATNKNKSDLPAYIVGNKIVIHATVWFPYIFNALNLTQHEELYVRMQNLSNEKQLKPVDIAEFDQYILDTHTNFDALTVAVKDNIHDLWWGMAWSQFIDDPYLGHIQGGIAGNGYGNPSTTTYYDGKHYKIDNAAFNILDGGANWVTPTEAPVSGESY